MAKSIKISVCMIVKDEESTLPKTLPAYAKLADQLIVVDTGSTDRTVEIAKSFGAEVYSFQWVDDYSAARNFSISHARGEWIMFPDADEFLRMEDVETLRERLHKSTAEGMVLRLYLSPFGTTEKKAFGQRVKAFRNHQGFRFIRPINERVADTSGKPIGGVIEERVALYHWGKDRAPEEMKSKRERYIRMYSAYITEHPDDADIHELLGVNWKESGNFDKAEHHFAEAAKFATYPELRQRALTHVGWIAFRKRDFPKSMEIANEVLREEPTAPAAMNLLAATYVALRRPKKALAILDKVLSMEIPKRFGGSFLDVSYYRALPLYFRDLALSEINKEAQKCLSAA